MNFINDVKGEHKNKAWKKKIRLYISWLDIADVKKFILISKMPLHCFQHRSFLTDIIHVKSTFSTSDELFSLQIWGFM